MRFSSFTYLVRQGLHSMRANRLMTFASMGVLTVCMVLIGLAYLLGVERRCHCGVHRRTE